MAGIDPGRVINGTFGSLYLDGKWLTNFTRCDIREEFEYIPLKLSGDRRIKHKLAGIKGGGVIGGYKVTSELQKALVENPTRSFEIISKLDDPESYGKERVRIPGVKFMSNSLAKWKTGEIVEEEWGFSFEGEPEFVDSITAS